MKVFKFYPPYQKNGKTTFPESKNRTGVYIIKENGTITYIGYSSVNLYKTMYRHFQRWHHKWQQVVTYADRLSLHKYTVRIIFCTEKQAPSLERSLIKKYRPRDNELKYEAYQSIFYDKQTVEVYKETDVSEEVPF